MNRTTSGIILILFFISPLSLVFDILPVKARSLDFKEHGANVALASLDDDWPMFHHDAFHSGYSTSIAPDTNNTIWNYPGSYQYSSPVVAYGKVYLGTWEKIQCLDATTGEPIWNYTTGSYVISCPAVSDGKVYVGSHDHNVYCLNATTGECIWNYTTGDWVVSSPVVAYGEVYVGSCDDNVYCLDAATGERIWNYTTGSNVNSSPATVDYRVYVGSEDGNVYCINATTGEHIWNYATAGGVYSSPAVADGKVYVGGGGLVYCLDASTGANIWAYMTAASSPAVAYGKVYYGSGGYDGIFYCRDAATGEYIWSCMIGASGSSSPAVADGKVYAGSEDGKVHCLDASTGVRIWDYATGGVIYSSPAIVDGKVFIGGQCVYCFGPIPVHNINTDLGYATIQEAIDAPETFDGHTILVAPGTYYEHLVLDKSLSLIGTDKFRTIIDGNLTETVMNIAASNVNITGFTIQNSGLNHPNSGICVTSSGGNNISYNIITNNYYGIYINESSNNRFYHNNLIDNTYTVFIDPSGYSNFWDNGYPLGGNYWGDYSADDKYHGPNQDIAGPDGMGDAAYSIDASNRDNYPLMGPVMKLVHNLNTGLDYVSIQQAISADETRDGHRIQVSACTYFEHVVVYKTIWLSGPPTPGKPFGIIDGGASGTVIHVRANDVVISDLTIQNSGSDFGDCGVHVESSYNCSVSTSKLQNNRIGVFLDNSSDCRLDSNYAHNNSECGLYLNYSENCEVYMNKANDNFYGIQISHSTNCIIYGGNEVSNNEYGILLDGSQSCLIGVLIDTPQGYRIFGNRAFSNEYGICVANCQDCDTAYMNAAENNTYGIWLKSSKRCWVGISRNGSTLIEEERALMTDFVENNVYGIRVDRSEDCQVEDCVRKNRYGVWIDSSRNCQIQITADNNTLGSICLSSSKNCLVQGSVDIYGSYVVADGILLRDSEDCVVSGTHVYHIGRKDGQSVCVDLDRCQNCTVERTLLEGAHAGILVENSSNCLLLSNQISNTLGGILLDISDKCTISDSDIGNNEILAIELVSSSSCTIKENRIYNNTDYGVLLASDQDTFYHNLFFNNTKNIENAWVNKTIGGYNTWDDGHEGNYWDDYKGFDTDGDRVGETPYLIDGKNFDFYPLIGAPSEDYRPPSIGYCRIVNALPSSSTTQSVNPLDVVKIQSLIIDQQTGIKQATLHYGVGGAFNNTVTMVQIGGDSFNGTYEAWICPWIFLNTSDWWTSANTANVTYQVETIDYAGNVGRSDRMVFSTAEQDNSLSIDITISQVVTQEELSVDMDLTVDGYLPAWMRNDFYIEVSNWRQNTRMNTAQLSVPPILSNGQPTLNYHGIASAKIDLIGESEAYPFDSYRLNLTFRFNPSLPTCLSDSYWANVHADAFKLLEEEFFKWANVTLHVNDPHYIQPGLVSTWGDPKAETTHSIGQYDTTIGFDVSFNLARQLNNVLPLLLLIISMTYMLGATLLGDARWNPEVKTAVYLSFFVMVAGFNFALRYLIPFRYGLTIAEVLFITLTVATAILSIGFIISNLLYEKVSQKKAERANVIADLFAISLTAVLLVMFSVPLFLLVIEIIGLSFGLGVRIAFMNRYHETANLK